MAELSRSAPLPDEGEATMEELVRVRKARLAEGPRRLLEMVAVAGQPLPRAAATAAFDESPGGNEPQALSTLRSERLVRVRYAQERDRDELREELLPYHDRIREAVVGELAPHKLAELHLTLARALQACGVAEPERLVFHLLSGGDQVGAARQAVDASEHAYRAMAFHQTVRLCRAALDTNTLPQPASLVIERRLAVALEGAGKPKEAADAYSHLAERDPGEAMTWRRLAARQYVAGGYIDEGMRVVAKLAEAANLRLPTTVPGLVVGMMLYRALLVHPVRSS